MQFFNPTSQVVCYVLPCRSCWRHEAVLSHMSWSTKGISYLRCGTWVFHSESKWWNVAILRCSEKLQSYMWTEIKNLDFLLYHNIHRTRTVLRVWSHYPFIRVCLYDVIAVFLAVPKRKNLGCFAKEENIKHSNLWDWWEEQTFLIFGAGHTKGQ